MKCARVTIVGFLIIFIFFLQACSQPSSNLPPSKSVTISNMSWWIENIPTDWWSASASTKPSLVYNFEVYFSGNISVSDIDYVRVYLPNNSSHYWSIDPSYFFNASGGYIGGHTNFFWNDNIKELPIGTMKSEIRLTNGVLADYSFTMGRPGNTSTGGIFYVYCSDDEATPTYASTSVAAINRATVNSFVNTSASNTITFTVKGSNVHNGWVWLYDSGNNYLGYTKDFLDPTSGAPFSKLNNGIFKNGDGQLNTLNINVWDIYDSYGSAMTSGGIFNTIQHCRVVVVDGSQYAGLPNKTYGTYDYKAISSLY